MTIENESGVHNLVFGGPRFCRAGGFSKIARVFARQKPAQKKPEIWENVVRDAKNSPWNATRQLFSGVGGWGCIKFCPVGDANSEGEFGARRIRQDLDGGHLLDFWM